MARPDGVSYLLPTGNATIGPIGPVNTATGVPAWFPSSPTWTKGGAAYVSNPARVATNVSSALDNNPNTRAVFTGTAPVWFAVDLGACTIVSRALYCARVM